MRTETHSLIEPLAIFGGTFDPVHYGHLRCAEDARQKLNLKKLVLFPSGKPPHRPEPQATTAQRLEMLGLACLEFPQLLIDARETRRDGPSYMVDTLQELRCESPQRPLLLLIGQDAANHLDTWFHWEQLFILAHIVILTRPDSISQYSKSLARQIQQRLGFARQNLLSTQAGGVLPLQVTSIDVSATNIKKTICDGRSLKGMLPAGVICYINENNLYLRA